MYAHRLQPNKHFLEEIIFSEILGIFQKDFNIVAWKTLMLLIVFIHNILAASKDQGYKSGMNYSHPLMTRIIKMTILERIGNTDIN